VSTLGSGGIWASLAFLSNAEPTRVLELELLRVRDNILKRPRLLVEEDLEGVREVTGVRAFWPEGLREPDNFPGLRVVTSTGKLSHEIESLENVSFSALDVRVAVEEVVWVRDRDIDGRECV
jgi:hypothetical protein